MGAIAPSLHPKPRSPSANGPSCSGALGLSEGKWQAAACTVAVSHGALLRGIELRFLA